MTNRREEGLRLLAAGQRPCDVARALGVTRQAVHQWVNRKPSRRVRAAGKAWWAPLLHDLRAAQGLTVDEAAERAGVSAAAWVNWERGQNAPTLPLFEAALGALGHEIEVMAR